jgi:putative Mg2+ transporter-C (MgtC) family protein
MEMCTGRGFRILEVRVDRLPRPPAGPRPPEEAEAEEEAEEARRARTAVPLEDTARVLLRLEGTADVRRLASEMFQTPGVLGMDVSMEPDPVE